MPLIADTPAGMVEVISFERVVDYGFGKTKANYGSSTPIAREAQARVRVISSGQEIDMPTSMCSNTMLVDKWPPNPYHCWQYPN
jgi:hypothetical protein